MAPSHPVPRPVRALLLALLVAWAGATLVAELTALRHELRHPPNSGWVADWRLGTPRAEGFASFLAAADRHLPDDSVVVLAAPVPEGPQTFFLTLWAAYHLPRHRVIAEGRAATGPGDSPGDYLVAYGVERPGPGRQEVARLPGGVVYRLAAGGEAGREEEAP